MFAPAQTPDYFDLDGLLSDDERQVHAAVARWVDERVLPIIGPCFEEGRFPLELVPEMAELGLFGPTFHEYGCAGLSNVAYGLIMQELERGDSGLRSFGSVQNGLVMYPIHAYGSPEQKDRWLPALARAAAIGCFGLTEPDGGSDPGTMRTGARRDGGDWVINGAKAWITNGTLADVAVVWAMTADGVRGFLVEKGTRGYTTRDIAHKFSLRALHYPTVLRTTARHDSAPPLAEGWRRPSFLISPLHIAGAPSVPHRRVTWRPAVAHERVIFGSAIVKAAIHSAWPRWSAHHAGSCCWRLGA